MMEHTSKIPVYCIPGLAAKSEIFKFIKLPKNYKIIYLDWIAPITLDETIQSYARRMSKKVTDDNAILIGVSFGGVMVQEMKDFLTPKQIIIISSIKSQKEMPFYFNISKKTSAHKILPNITKEHIDQFSKYAITDWGKHKSKLYQTYFKVEGKNYLPWAINSIINWSRKEADPDIFHIHGTKDTIFPIKNIKSCFKIKDGTHAMILNKAKTVNKYLLDILRLNNDESNKNTN